MKMGPLILWLAGWGVLCFGSSSCAAPRDTARTSLKCCLSRDLVPRRQVVIRRVGLALAAPPVFPKDIVELRVLSFDTATGKPCSRCRSDQAQVEVVGDRSSLRMLKLAAKSERCLTAVHIDFRRNDVEGVQPSDSQGSQSPPDSPPR